MTTQIVMDQSLGEYVARQALNDLSQLQRTHDAIVVSPMVAYLPQEYIDLMDRAAKLVGCAL